MKIIGEAIDLAAEWGDAAIEHILKGEIITGIPVLGEIVKLAKITLGIRERLFLSKIQAFLNEANKVPPEDAAKFSKELKNDPKLQKRTGELVVFSIERADSNEKAKIIGKLFYHYVKGDLNLTDLKRLLFAVDSAFLEDLLLFPSAINHADKKHSYVLESLASTGLVKAIYPSLIDEIGESPKFLPTEIGLKYSNYFQDSPI